MTNIESTTKAAVYTFAPDAITCNGQKFPVEYSINPTSGVVCAFLNVQQDGKPVKIRLKVAQGESEYPAILVAAQQEREARKQQPAAAIPEGYTATTTAEGNVIAVSRHIDANDKPAEAPETVTTEAPAQKVKNEQPAPKRSHKAKGPRPAKPLTVQQDAPQAPEAAPIVQQQPEAVKAAPVVQQVQPARDPKQARGPIPEKSFIGLEIKGNGWKILFDGEHERTRVIFKREPSKAAKMTVEKAGFYWSPALESWNKKLTFKAFRAAQALANDLRAVCG